MPKSHATDEGKKELNEITEACKYVCRRKHEKMKQAGAEQCQAQLQLWKMLLEELDLDQLECLSLYEY